MSGPADPTFESDVRRRIYEYIERNGAASPSEIRHEVRIDAGPPASKPARSSASTTERTPMPVAQVREHLRTLDADGYLTQENGTYRVDLGTARAAHAVEGGTITIRPARHEDLSELADVIRGVASEHTYIIAHTIAEAIDHEETLLRHNERQSRVFFVATYAPNGGESDGIGAGNGEAEDENGADSATSAGEEDVGSEATGGSGEIVGWIHLEGLRQAELRHVAEFTVGVAADHRHEGIGERLLDHGTNWAAEAGYEKVYGTVPATNEEAISFLRSRGWEREATHGRHYRIDGEYVDEALLATWL